jgi:MFS transporter, PPP family, 3-phenylpropionic acid transporter
MAAEKGRCVTEEGVKKAGKRRDGLWVVRLYYFAFIGSGGFLFPFLVLFFRRQGLSGTEIGLLSTISALASLLAAPTWGRWMDITARPRLLLQVVLLGTAFVSMYLSQQKALMGIAIVYTIHAIFAAGVEPSSNNLVMKFTNSRAGTGFGSVRLWGSFGWAVIVLVAGWLIEHTSLFYGFVGYALMNVLSAIILSGVDHNFFKKKNYSAGYTNTQNLIKELFSNRLLRGLAIALLLLWLTTTGARQFEAVYMDQLGAGEGLIGISSTIVALTEIPAMLWADRLISQQGPGRVLMVATLLDVVIRCFVLLIPTVPVIMIARAIGGISFSLYSVGIVVLVSSSAPDYARATALALYTVTLRSFIQMFGGPLGGFAFDAVGPYWLYAIAAVGGVASWLVLRLSMQHASAESHS